MNRSTLAFLVAPLAAPLLLLPWLSASGDLSLGWIVTTTSIGAFLSYAGTLIVAIPLYRQLRSRGLVRIWIACASGSVIGGLVWLLFSVLFPLSLGQGLEGVRFALTDPRSLTGVFWPGAALGMVVGALFWLIARPDKQT